MNKNAVASEADAAPSGIRGSAKDSEDVGQSTASEGFDYFSLAAVTSHSVNKNDPRRGSLQDVLVPGKSNATVGISDLSGPDALAPTTHTATESAREELLSSHTAAPARTLRVETGTPIQRMKPQRSLSEYPKYPNQSLSALQFQRYPERPHLSWASRPSTAHAAPHSANALLSSAQRDHAVGAWGSRTAGNTPAQTPSLFAPNAAVRHMWAAYDGSAEHSPYPSPYLHPVQPQPPRETNIADRGVDTFSGRKMINQYEIIEELGRGVHGKVKLARNLENNEYVAIKVLQRFSKRRRLGKAANSQDDKVKKEVAILKKVHHPNVVSLLEVIDDPEISKIYVVLEFCELREIDWRVKGSSEIVVTENRRLEREAQGMPDNSVGANSDKFLRAAARRRERYRRQRPRANRTLTGGSDFWSLEYAEESDEDDDEVPEIETVSRASSVASRRSTRWKHDGDDQFASHGALSSPVMPHIIPHADLSTSMHQLNPDSQSTTDHGSFFPPSYVESTKGPSSISSKDSRRGRQSSVADSMNSQITEIMEEEIPEDYRYVPTMTLAESRAAFRDAVLGLEYLHYQGIIHRDIKPANLLRTRDHHVKISDFGVSYLGKPMREGNDSEEVSETEAHGIEEETELAKTVGTPSFYAPELCAIDFASETPVVTSQIDVWAIGVTLYCLIFARTPFIAENEFALMRRIAEEDVFIPRKRLKAVDHRPVSRSNSRSPMFPLPGDRRLPTEWAHEEIDDLLHDLLKRLFVKNPKERITLMEVKYHPWVLQDIGNHSAWLDETDPARHTHGKKIEISKQEVAEAVIPLKPMDRVRSVARKVIDVVNLGIGRKRVQSTASSSDNCSALGFPESSATTNPGQKPVLRLEDHISSALRAARDREHEHPLAQSVSVSPGSGSENDPHGYASNEDEVDPLSSSSSRPGMPERDDSTRLTSVSVRTIRQSDIDRGRPKFSGMLSGDLPENETIQESSGTTQLNALFTGSLSRDPSSASARSSLQITTSPDQARIRSSLSGEPSLALNTSPVSGQLQSPTLFKAVPPISESAVPSPYTRNAPVTGTQSEYFGSYTFDTSAAFKTENHGHDSVLRSSLQTSNMGSGFSSSESPYIQPTSPATDEQYRQALDSLTRRRILDDEQQKERSAQSSRPGSSRGRLACPPSPDDDLFAKHRPRSETQSPRAPQSHYAESNARVSMLPTRFQNVSSASSEDQFTPGISRSTSFPSVQSAVSANSSVALEPQGEEGFKEHSGSSSGSTVHDPSFLSLDTRRGSTKPGGEDDDGYTGEVDHEEESSDSEEDFIVMGKGKKSQPPTRSTSSAGTHASSKTRERRGTGFLRRPQRTESTNTMKNVDSNDDGC